MAFLLSTESLVWANEGDSRLLIVNNNKTVQITKDHRLDNPLEKKRIMEKGLGKIRDLRVWVSEFEGIKSTRSLGLKAFKDAGIIATPETKIYEIRKGDMYFVAVCDGVWGKLSNEEVGKIAKKSKYPEEIALRIKDKAIKKGGEDNLTVIVGKV